MAFIILQVIIQKVLSLQALKQYGEKVNARIKRDTNTDWLKLLTII